LKQEGSREEGEGGEEEAESGAREVPMEGSLREFVLELLDGCNDFGA